MRYCRGWGLCVQGMSRVQYAVSVTLKGGASLADCQFRLAGEARSGTSGQWAAGRQRRAGAQVTVTDSRGRAETVYGSSIRVYEYRPPVITASAAVRCSASGTEQDDGAYLRGAVRGYLLHAGGAERSDDTGALSGHGRTVERVYHAAQRRGRPLSAADWRHRGPMRVELRAEDTVGTVRTVRYTAATKQVTVHLRSGGKGLALGKYAETEALECAWPAVFYGDVAVSGSKRSTARRWRRGCSRWGARI